MAEATRITDFGLARLIDSANGLGEIAGTPAYISRPLDLSPGSLAASISSSINATAPHYRSPQIWPKETAA